MTVALTWVPCRQCGEACVSTPARCWQALCWRCRPAPVIAAHSVPWRPTIARVLPGELGPVIPHDGRTTKERESAAKLAAERLRYRVLVPARPAQRHEIPAAALAAIDELQDGRGPQCVWATYAQAEDTERAELVRSIALASVVDNVKGVAFWENGRWSSGMTLSPTHHSCTTLDEWIVRAQGEEWTPPSCPRCGRVGVKMRQDGQPYKHKTISGEDCI
jgi:hypothetical protein